MGIQYRQLQAKRRRTGKNPGTMTNMTSDDIVDSSFSDGGTIKALEFDGVDDYVDLGNDSSIKPTNNLSVVIWVLAGTQDSNDVWIGDWGASGSNRWVLQVDDGSVISNYKNRYMLWVSTDGTNIAKNYYHANTFGNEPLTAGWHQVGFTFSSDVLKVYFDGAEVTTSNGLTKVTDDTCNTIFDSSTNVRMGVRNAANYGWNHTTLANASIWDTGVLTATDFSNLYNSGSGLDPNDLTPSGSANLVSSWLWNTDITYPTIVDNVK